MANEWDDYDRQREAYEQQGRLAPNSYIGRRITKGVSKVAADNVTTVSPSRDVVGRGESSGADSTQSPGADAIDQMRRG